MEKVAVFLVDDRDFLIDEAKNVLSKPTPPFLFEFEFYGFIQDSSLHGTKASELFRKYEDRFGELEGPAILLLDLGLQESELNASQYEKVEEWFPSVLTKFELDKRMEVGLYLVIRALENRKWHGELCIVSDFLMGSVRRELEKCLLRLAQSIKTNSAIRVGQVYVRFFGEGMVGELGVAAEKTSQAVQWFLQDFDDIWWFLRPPMVPNQREDEEIEWFDGDKGAHDQGEGFEIHLEAVSTRFRRWGKVDYAKALMCCDKKARYQIKWNDPKSVRSPEKVDWRCLSDFFDEMEDDGLLTDHRITFPTTPAFPFLIAVREFLNYIRSSAGLQQSKVLFQCLDGEESVLALGIKASGCWELASRLWSGKKIDDRIGTTMNLFMRALRAESDIDSRFRKEERRPLLADVFRGIPNVATPWITKDFVGVSWKSFISSIPTE
jgi:hypothetical protein